ncbi:hypothetical protein LX32DRAFT_343118 [Colletotrichum zoysiae]|uniref:Uncharacterized protein n=1 Tax=Colletotrichum zoysiae TaxID=1216348 RepID=A0AAD9HIZ4_9PEZI|nr:hypothetical protein LX32DRAFT_343118 [Colletotrichum zoysiae]
MDSQNLRNMPRGVVCGSHMSATTMSHNGSGGRRTDAMSPSLWGRPPSQHPQDDVLRKPGRTAASNSTRLGVARCPASVIFVRTHWLNPPPPGGLTRHTTLRPPLSHRSLPARQAGAPAGFLHRRDMHTRHHIARPQAYATASINTIVYGCPPPR